MIGLLQYVNMPGKQIKNEDYTTLQFMKQMQNLTRIFHRSQSLQDNPHPQPSQEQQEQQHGPSSHQKHYPTAKLLRHHLDPDSEQKYKSNTKQMQTFKIFYEVLMTDILDKKQIEDIWIKFQNSVNKQDEFKNFLEWLIEKKDIIKTKNNNSQQTHAAQSKNLPKQLPTTQIQPSPAIKKQTKRSKTCTSQNNGNKQQKSAQKYKKHKQHIKNQVKKQISYIKKVIQHGLKFIHS